MSDTESEYNAFICPSCNSEQMEDFSYQMTKGVVSVQLCEDCYNHPLPKMLMPGWNTDTPSEANGWVDFHKAQVIQSICLQAYAVKFGTIVKKVSESDCMVGGVSYKLDGGVEATLAKIDTAFDSKME